jgi:NAD-dependent SIR2 family protein deacetylase
VVVRHSRANCHRDVTTDSVEPAASLVHMASEGGALTVQINTESIELEDRLSYYLRGSAAEVLPQLVRRL